MKRIFTFLMSLVLVAGSMVAQTFPVASTKEAPKYYTIGSYNRGGVLTEVDGVPNHVAVNENSYWYFTKADDNGGLHFCNFNGKYLTSEGSISETPAVWYVLSNGVNEYGVSISKTNPISTESCLDAKNTGTGVGTWAPNANDWEGTTWVFVEVDYMKNIEALLEANEDNHAELPALGQYTTAGYEALAAAKETVKDPIAAAAAITAFEATKNLYLFTIDGGYSNYAVGKSVFENEAGELLLETTDPTNKAMLWMFDMTATEVGVTDKVVVRNAATGNLFWGADFIKVTETSENDGAGIADDGIFLFYKNGTGYPVHAENRWFDTPAVVGLTTWGSYEATSASAWKFTFVGISNPAAYDLSEVAAAYEAKADAFAGLQSNMALYQLTAVQEAWGELVYATIDPLNSAIAANELVLKADVEAAIEQMDAITAVVEFYSGDAFTAALDKAWAALDELDEESDAYAALLAAKNVSAVTTVAELEAKITEIDEIIAALEPEVDPNDYTSYIVNADLSTADAWADGGTKGIKNGYVKVGSESPFDFCQTITLPAGQYKMTAKAAYRYGDSEQVEYNAIEVGTETHLVKLYAETSSYKYETNVMNRYEGASDVNYAAENLAVSEVNGLFVPNASDAVKAWFDADQYINEIVFNVQEEGEVKIGITRVGGIAGDYTNIGAWTLTRLGDAEADPQPEYTEEDYDLTEGTWSDATSYLVNADFTSFDGWTIDGLEKNSTSYRVMEFYSGWGSQNKTAASAKQNVDLPAGIYRLSGSAWYRYSETWEEKYDANKSMGYLVAGEESAVVPTIASAGLDPLPDYDKAADAFYTKGLYGTSVEFALDNDANVAIGYECEFDYAYSWFIVGAVKLEKKVTLKDNFLAQAMEYSTYGQSSMALYSLGAVQEKFAETQAVVEALYGAISADQKVLKVDVIAAMELMTETLAEIKPVVEYYDGKFSDTKWAMFDIQENSTPNSEEVATAFDEAVQAALNVYAVTTVAELEAKVAEMEAARQVYVMNAVPGEGYPFDMSFKIVNAAVTSADGWVNGSTAGGQQYAGAPDNTYLDWCHWGGNLDTKDMYQELTGLPSGVYELKVATRAHADMSGVIYAGEFSAEIHHVGNTGNDLGGGWGWTVVEEIIVVDGKLTIGFKTETNGNGVWAGADNFQLNFVSELPEEVLLPLKKEAFLARYAKFEALTETLDFSWNAINENYYYTVQEAAFAVKEAIDEATVEILNEQLAAMDEAEEMLAKAYAAGAYHNEVAAAFENALGFATVVNQEVCAEAYAVWESKSGMNFGYSVATVEDLEVATAELLAAFFSYVSNATPAEGTLFDVSFLVQNPDFEKNMDGWTCEKAGWNQGQGYGDVSGIAEIADWNAGSWESSISQTLTGLPNGAYVVKAVWMAAIGIEMTFSANEGETTVTGIGDTGGNVDKEGNVVDMGQGFRGWQYVEAEGSVEDGELTIAVSSSSTALHTWSNADAFKLYYGGYVAKDPTGIENIDAEVETVIYDLSGRRVQKMEKGIYIVNGKKVIVK